MRHSTAVLSAACLMGIAVIGCDTATEPLMLRFGGRQSGGQNGQPFEVFPNAVQIVVGQSAQLQTNLPLSLLNQLQWISSRPTIAPVSPSGQVTGRFPGVVTITARLAFDTTQAATATVTVLGVGN
jgi:hypothetical protein